jgi:uncharacterized protein with HEPN domain
MRRDEQRLNDILEALETVSRFIRSKSEAEFLNDEVLRSAVAQQLTVVGEAAARMSTELRQRHGHVPWMDIIGFRNIVVHEYFGIDWPTVWHTATEEAPECADKSTRFCAKNSLIREADSHER